MWPGSKHSHRKPVEAWVCLQDVGQFRRRGGPVPLEPGCKDASHYRAASGTNRQGDLRRHTFTKETGVQAQTIIVESGKVKSGALSCLFAMHLLVLHKKYQLQGLPLSLACTEFSTSAALKKEVRQPSACVGCDMQTWQLQAAAARDV